MALNDDQESPPQARDPRCSPEARLDDDLKETAETLGSPALRHESEVQESGRKAKRASICATWRGDAAKSLAQPSGFNVAPLT